MALQINLPAAKTRVGVAAPSAYARINRLTFNTLLGTVELHVDAYLDAAARAANKAPITSYRFTGKVGTDLPSLDQALANGVRAALYTWLKTKPEFTGAMDV
jgi:hypothetical protein